MKLIIDGDGCPVVYETILVAKEYDLTCIILCDTAHEYHYDGVQTIVIDKGKDSVDFALVNKVNANDIVITQDYGLASMCLAKHAFVLNQNGMEYTIENIDGLLNQRYEHAKQRAMKVKYKKASKRSVSQDDAFVDQLIAIIRREGILSNDCD